MKLRRLRYPSKEASEFIDLLRARRDLDTVEPSPETLRKSEEVFGKALSPLEVVRRVLQDVKSEGDEALQRYCKAFDGISLSSDQFRVKKSILKNAFNNLDKSLRSSLLKARENIETCQKALLPPDVGLEPSPGIVLETRFVPLRRAGIYVPGGTASYPSSVLMNVVPAMVAGVKDVAVFTPPEPKDALLAACYMAGVDEVYRIGGAQAVAAMAYGTETIGAVDFIAGPGNLFVSLAKREVFGHVGIDMFAGPSEVMVIADAGQNPVWIAADMLAQAEHDPLASAVLATPHENLADGVEGAIDNLLARHSRGDIARKSLERFGAVVITDDLMQAAHLANDLAPEHLEIVTESPRTLLPAISSSGAVFIGATTPEPVGDYIAGPSHTLPTGGTARFSSGLSALTFMRRMSVVQYAEDAMEDAGKDIITLAESEGLPYHAESIRVRLDKDNGKGKR